MPKLSEYNLSAAQTYLVYGDSKGGKTFGAGTFPRPNFIDFDNGIRTLQGADFIKRHGWRPDVMFEQFDEKSYTKQGVVDVPDAFDGACRYFDKCMQRPIVDEFDTWVVDTGTSLVNAAMNKSVYLLGGTGFVGAKSKTHEEAKKYGLLLPKQQDFGGERSMVEQFVQMVKDSGKHVVFLCHEKEFYNDEGVITKITPLLTGKSVAAVSATFDELYRLTTKKIGPEMTRVLLTQSNGVFMAGSRIGVPNDTEWNWDALQAALAVTHKMRESAKEIK